MAAPELQKQCNSIADNAQPRVAPRVAEAQPQHHTLLTWMAKANAANRSAETESCSYACFARMRNHQQPLELQTKQSER